MRRRGENRFAAECILQCFHYNPKLGKYNFAVMGALRDMALAMLLGLIHW